MNSHTVEAGYVRGKFWTPLDERGSATVYSGPPMAREDAVEACARHGDTGFWQFYHDLT